MPIYALGDRVPAIDPAAWVHPQAVVIGNVAIGPLASIWPCAVLRGDHERIEVGARTSIQDGAVLHVTVGHPTVIGAECVIGHTAYLEGCTVDDGVLVGAHASVLPGCHVGRGAAIAAGAVLTASTDVPAGARARGVPARIDPGAADARDWSEAVERYVELAERFRRDLRLVG